MSNREQRPSPTVCDERGDGESPTLLTPREVPLGGPRAMTVRRTLPQRARSLIGAWCFVDHYGPDPVADTGGMAVPRHPHTGLATVSWLFTGAIDHLDSAGHRAQVLPGEVNLMVAGRGITHSEFSSAEATTLHGAQLWYALPDATRHMAPVFTHHVPEPIRREGCEIRVFIGELAGATSPVETFTPGLLGAEILLEPGAEVELTLDQGYEHGILVDAGSPTLGAGDIEVPTDHLAYLPVGTPTLRLAASSEPVRVLLLGGEPLGERIVMWWNFIGRTHEEIEAFRAAYQQEIGAEPGEPPAGGVYPDGAPYPRFGPWPDGEPAALPAPALPGVELRPRG